MDIGICTTDFNPLPISKLFSRIRKYRFSCLQFSFASIGEEEIPVAIDDRMIRQIRSAGKDNNLRIVAVNGTFNVISPDPSEKSNGFERFPGLLNACRELDCQVVSLCTGTRSTESMWSWHPENDSRQAWDEMIESIGQLVQMAEKHDVYLGVETEAANVVSTPEKARALLDEIGSSHLKIIMDCANLFPRGAAFRDNVRPVLENAFSCLGKDIILAHGKDILAGQGIDFTSPGKGIIDYALFLTLLHEYGYKDDMVLHGIKDESEMEACRLFMRERIEQNLNF